jgi:hypothetical protein
MHGRMTSNRSKKSEESAAKRFSAAQMGQVSGFVVLFLYEGTGFRDECFTKRPLKIY